VLNFKLGSGNTETHKLHQIGTVADDQAAPRSFLNWQALQTCEGFKLHSMVDQRFSPCNSVRVAGEWIVENKPL
jgi:hypothetical protein